MDFLQVGKIVNTHALQGEVKVISNSDFKEDRFKKGSQLVIDFNGDHIEVTVATHRVHKGADLLKFKHLNSINDVEKFKGCALLVSADELDELDENEFYYFEIIGCSGPGQKDALIPYIEDVVKSVDIESKKVTINVLEGLL